MACMPDLLMLLGIYCSGNVANSKLWTSSFRCVQNILSLSLLSSLSPLSFWLTVPNEMNFFPFLSLIFSHSSRTRTYILEIDCKTVSTKILSIDIKSGNGGRGNVEGNEPTQKTYHGNLYVLYLSLFPQISPIYTVRTRFIGLDGNGKCCFFIPDYL